MRGPFSRDLILLEHRRRSDYHPRAWRPHFSTPIPKSSNVNLVLFVVNDRGQLRSYRVDRIAGVSVTREPFTPRFVIEF